jgi:hypothetical protein
VLLTPFILAYSLPRCAGEHMTTHESLAAAGMCLNATRTVGCAGLRQLLHTCVVRMTSTCGTTAGCGSLLRCIMRLAGWAPILALLFHSIALG